MGALLLRREHKHSYSDTVFSRVKTPVTAFRVIFSMLSSVIVTCSFKIA
jgi:hypothetical protein